MSTDETADVAAPPPLIYGASLLLGLALGRFLPTPFIEAQAARTIGTAAIVVALTIGFPAVLSMRRSHTNVNPYRPTTALVVSGPFRFTRNPLYLSLTLLYFGIACITQSLWALVLLVPVIVFMQRGVIDREERYLERRFGADYLAYKARVRRWL